MPFPALKEAQEKLAAKRAEMGKIFEEAGYDLDFKKVKSLPSGVPVGDTRAVAAHVRSLNDELSDLGKEVADYTAVEKASKAADEHGEKAGRSERGSEGRGGDGAEQMSIGEAFVKSNAYKGKSGASGPEAHLDVELKTVMSTGAGWATRPPRNGVVVDFATRPVQVTDLLPATNTDQSAIFYMEETTFTNNAAETAESTQGSPGTYPESALALTEKSSLVRKIATWLPVTDEQLEDVSQAEGYINNRLPFMLRQRLDSQILVGDATGVNLRGILNVVGIQTQAKGADPSPDSVYKAMVKIQTIGFASPSDIVMNPNDWQNIRLLRTADGIYIWGNPSDAGPARMWGLQVTQAIALTQGTALVGDFPNFSELSTRRGVDVQVTNAHSTFFIEGKQALRADVRVALVVYRPTAFCTVTGL